VSYRGFINVEIERGVWNSVYLHHGDQESVEILTKFYNSHHKMVELLSYGDISILGKSIGEKIDFHRRDIAIDSDGYYEQCLFYHRDRGEELAIGLYSHPLSDEFGVYYCLDGEFYYSGTSNIETNLKPFYEAYLKADQ
jgi:hypothetical protein